MNFTSSILSSLSNHIVFSIALSGFFCGWVASLATSMFMPDSSTQKSVRRGLGKIICATSATIAAVFNHSPFTIASLFLVAILHLIDLQLSNSRWMQPRIAPFTITTLLAISLTTGLAMIDQPLFFAGVTLGVTLLHIQKMRRYQQEFFQNFQLLRDHLTSFESNRVIKTTERYKNHLPSDDKQLKAS